MRIPQVFTLIRENCTKRFEKGLHFVLGLIVLGLINRGETKRVNQLVKF